MLPSDETLLRGDRRLARDRVRLRVRPAYAERSAAGIRAFADLLGRADREPDADDELGARGERISGSDARRGSRAVTKPSKLDRAQIKHVAALASLSLTEDEVDAMTTELAAIVAYVDELGSVDTTNVPPTAHVQLERAAWRADVVQPSLSQDDALSQAPQTAHGGFAVPVFVES